MDLKQCPEAVILVMTNKGKAAGTAGIIQKRLQLIKISLWNGWHCVV